MFDLMAKFTFCATLLPVIAEDFSSLETITPITLPLSSSSGPPELPELMGTVPFYLSGLFKTRFLTFFIIKKQLDQFKLEFI